MTELEKEQKMIGLFMGFEMDPEDYPYKLRIPHFLQIEPKVIPNPMVNHRDYCEWADSYQNGVMGGGYCLSWGSLEFNDNWSWLMVVVDKIHSLGYRIDMIMTERQTTTNVYTDYGVASKGEESTLLQSTYKSVVDFINWYNKH
jgi:hypothetical protein